MINMIGIGPFITIPLLLSALGGPQAMLGWAVALVIVICDGMVWSELGAAMPGPGGSFGYLREAFGRERVGRLMAFQFVWQFILSGPLEIASGYIGFSQYLGYIWKGITPRQTMLERLALRGMSEREAELRLAQQLTDEEFRAAADAVIENDGDRERTRERVRAAWLELRRPRA